MRDRLVDDLPAVDVVDVQRPVLGAVLRQRDRDLLAVRGRNEEVDGGLARRVDDIRIHDDTLGRRVVKVGQRHQERLLPGRLHLQREEGASTGQEPLVRRPLGLQQLLDTGPQRVSPGDPAEVGTAALPLGLRPGDGLRRGGVLQPSVVLGDLDSVKGVCHRDPRSPHRGELGHVISQQPRPAHAQPDPCRHLLTCSAGPASQSSACRATDGGLRPARIQPARAAAAGTPTMVIARSRTGTRLSTLMSLRCPAASAR